MVASETKGKKEKDNPTGGLIELTDITKIYVDVTGTAKADIMFRFLIDSTPGLSG